MARQVKRISDLPEAGPIQGDELLEMVQGGVNVRVRADELGGDIAIGDVQGLTEALDERVLDDDPRLSDSRVPKGGAGGVLSGQYPNPGFAVPMATAAQLDGKVDKVEGKGLSTNDLTDPLYDKLVGLEGTHWRGTFVSLAALEAGVTDPQAGDYADVDVVGEDVQRYIWDATDSEWVVQSGAAAPITAAQVKLLYESNPDTNAFTDADEAKLDSVKEWATAETQDAAQTALGMSVSGKAVATGTPAQGRTALGLGTAATKDVGEGYGQVMEVGAFGLGGAPVSFTWSSFEAQLTRNLATAQWPGGVEYPADSPEINGAKAIAIGSAGVWESHLAFSAYGHNMYLRGRSSAGAPFLPWVRMYHTGNTTADSNGFIKIASPIIKLHSDRIESNGDDTPTFQRLDTGHYQLTGCNGLRLDDGWYIETPHDRNKVPYFNVEWEQSSEPETDAGVLEEPADVNLTIRCYERVWNPQTGTYDNGDPVDIPDGRWIDLRMNEVRQPEPEMPEAPDEPELPPEPAEPVIPSVVTMAQAKLALLYAGLYEQVEQALADLPEPQKTAALIEWNHRQTLEREHPLVGQVAAELGLTEQQLDELFLDASVR